jgi:hypothetical protein
LTEEFACLAISGQSAGIAASTCVARAIGAALGSSVEQACAAVTAWANTRISADTAAIKRRGRRTT